jgi:hypothetical protein
MPATPIYAGLVELPEFSGDYRDIVSISDTDISSPRSHQSRTKTLSNNIWDAHVRELELVMYYIDSIFYIQFPFYSSAPTTDRRGWLYGLLQEARPFYNACLSLSSYTDSMLDSTDAMKRETRLQESGDYLSSALSELSVRLQSQFKNVNPSKDEIITIMCIIQLLSLEVYNTPLSEGCFQC